MKLFILVTSLIQLCRGQFGQFEQDYGYVTVREGAHMFYWLFYTTADETYTNRPLVVWLQGGPGGSSTGYGNFEILGPLDLSLQERNFTWVKEFNVLFLDNPVGTGFSYVEDFSYLTTDNDQIATDFVNFMRGFYAKHTEFEHLPLYIYGQSYGGKMAIDIALHMRDAEQAGTVASDLRGVALGNAFISPLDVTHMWGPLLYAAGLVDRTGLDDIEAAAMATEEACDAGQYTLCTNRWGATQWAVFAGTNNVDFYNILNKMPVRNVAPLLDMDPLDLARTIATHKMNTREAYDLDVLMNTLVKEALGIPEHVTWGAQSNAVFNYLAGDFMKPVTQGIERLLNETDIIVTVYNGNLDLICGTSGQILWVNRLQWAGAEAYRNSPRHPIWVDDKLEGYYKSHGNFRFFWINVAGHSVPGENPAGASAFLRDMTSFG